MTGRPQQNCERNNEVPNSELIEEKQACVDQLAEASRLVVTVSSTPNPTAFLRV